MLFANIYRHFVVSFSFTFVSLLMVFVGLEAEKRQEGLVKGIESFNKTGLAHTEIHEKNPLPDQDSRFSFHAAINPNLLKPEDSFIFQGILPQVS